MATAVGYANGQLRIDVQDDESIQLTLDRTSIPENSGKQRREIDGKPIQHGYRPSANRPTRERRLNRTWLRVQ